MVEKKIDPIKVDAFGDAAAAFFEFHSIVKLKGAEGLYRPSGRVTMLFKRTQTVWRAIHYHESALAAQAADQINRMKALAKSQDHHGTLRAYGTAQRISTSLAPKNSSEFRSLDGLDMF